MAASKNAVWTYSEPHIIPLASAKSYKLSLVCCFHHSQKLDLNGITISPTRTKTWTYWSSYSCIKFSIVLDTTHISIHFINSSTSDHKFQQKTTSNWVYEQFLFKKTQNPCYPRLLLASLYWSQKKIEKWFTINHLSGSLLFHLSVDYPLVN